MIETPEIPDYLYFLDRKDELIALISSLPIPPINKKYAFIDWCKAVGYKYKGIDIYNVTGFRPGTFL